MRTRICARLPPVGIDREDTEGRESVRCSRDAGDRVGNRLTPGVGNRVAFDNEKLMARGPDGVDAKGGPLDNMVDEVDGVHLGVLLVHPRAPILVVSSLAGYSKRRTFRPCGSTRCSDLTSTWT